MKLYDVVRLTRDVSRFHLKRGDRGTIVMAFTEPTIGFMVEFIDEKGKTIAVDRNGNVVAQQDARQQAHAPAVMTLTTYDQLNRVRTITQAAGSAGPTDTVVTEKQYDHDGNVTALILHNSAISGGDQVTSYIYDDFNRKITETLPSPTDGSKRISTYAYDLVGNLLTATDPIGQENKATYDVANRVLTRTYLKADKSTVAETRTYGYDKVGKVMTVSDLTGTSTYTYDALAHPLTETRATIGQTAYTVTSAYDVTGNYTKVVYPGSNRTVISSYDPARRQITVADGSHTTQFAYDVDGNRVRCQESNGVVTTSQFDALNRCISTQSLSGTVTVSGYSYVFDLVGNRRTVVETLPNQPSGGRTITYVYDDQYRLTSESWSGTTISYAYDPAGNRLSKVTTGTGAGSVTSSYDVLNRLMSFNNGSAITCTYDLNGNQLSQSGSSPVSFTWDTCNRLVSTTAGGITYAFSYDYRTRRQTKQAGSTTTFFRYNGGDSFQEMPSGTTGTAVEFVRGPGMGGGIGSILYSDRTMVSGGILETFGFNPAVGHVSSLTNASGALSESNLFDAFGNDLNVVGSSLNNRLANTKERDISVANVITLDNHGMRYYNPVTGRYISRDPLEYADGMNAYLYVHNNPINHIDPLGLSEESGWSWSNWDWDPIQAVVHGLYDTGAFLGSYSVKPIVRGTMKLVYGMNEGADARKSAAASGGGNATTAGGGMEQGLAQVQSGASDIAGSMPGTSFTGPVVGPNKVGYTPASLENSLANKGISEATKAAIGEVVDPAILKATWYHGTTSNSLESLAKGLDPQKAGTAKGNVEGFFVTADPEVAAMYAKLQAAEHGGTPVILSASGKDVGKFLDQVPNPHGGEMVIPKDKFGDVKPGTFKVDEKATKTYATPTATE
jgi:RHS repeat-associated protein